MLTVGFKSRLGFNQHDPTMTQEQSILLKIKSVFSAVSIIFQHSVLSYIIDAYFPKYKLAIEVNEQGHKGRDIDQEIQRQKALEKELDCQIIRINPAKENFGIFTEIGRIQNFIVEANKKLPEESTKKFFIDEISNKPLGLEFKSNNSIKTKCLKYVIKKILPKL